MTYEEFVRRWDALSSRKRDVWVAEAVLGCRVVYVRALEGCRLVDAGRGELEPVLAEVPCLEEHGAAASLACLPEAEYVLNVVPCYTAEIAAAWEVVECLRRRFGAVSIEVGGAPEEPSCRVAVGGCVAEGKAVPEAVARAALLAACVGDVRDG